MKRCPFCAEEIQDAAIVYKHCGRDLTTPAPLAPTKAKSPWRRVGTWVAGIVLGLWLVGLLLPEDRADESTTSERGSYSSSMAEPLRRAIVSAGESCDTVTRTFLQGEREGSGRYWNVACGNGNTFSVHQAPGGEAKVMSCAVLTAVTKLECFRTFDEQRKR